MLQFTAFMGESDGSNTTPVQNPVEEGGALQGGAVDEANLVQDGGGHKKSRWKLILVGIGIFIVGILVGAASFPIVYIPVMNALHSDEFAGVMLNQYGEEVPMPTWDEENEGITQIEMPDTSGIGVRGEEIPVTDEDIEQMQPTVDKVKELVFPGFADMEPFDVRAFVYEGVTETLFLYGNNQMAFDVTIRSDNTIGFGASMIELDWDVAAELETIDDVERLWTQHNE